MVLPAGISNGQIQQLEHSREGVLKANLITPYFPPQCPLILAADIPQLSCECHRKPAASGQVRMISCHLLLHQLCSHVHVTSSAQRNLPAALAPGRAFPVSTTRRSNRKSPACCDQPNCRCALDRPPTVT